MKSKSQYIKRIANEYHNALYYEFDIKNKDFLMKESKRLKTENKEKLTGIIKEKTGEEKIFTVLKNIYKRNKTHVFKENTEDFYNSNLLNIVASVPMLMVSYSRIRKNSGSVTFAQKTSDGEYNKLNSDQKNLLNRNYSGADEINLKAFQDTSRLLKEGKYPWGTSKQIYIEKSGKPGSKRPLMIPPFMDRVVQEAIKQVLIAIYEPTFDKMNVSFGFRPNRSSQDAIYSLSNRSAQGLDKALEGDIKSAYDRVNIKKLIQILGKKIRDRKFLKLIEERLKYEFYDTERYIFVKDKEGIPQGGTDSPYLWNIYMLEFDNFVIKNINEFVNNINLKNRKIKDLQKNKNTKILDKRKVNLTNTRDTIRKIVKWIRQKKKENVPFKDDLIKLSEISLSEWFNFDSRLGKISGLKNAKLILKVCDIQSSDEETIILNLQSKQKEIQNKMDKLPYYDLNRKFFRLIYTRYADHWIILTNLKVEILKSIKEKIAIFLREELGATLSEEKTLLTDIRLTPAHFLGFEIKNYKCKKIGKYTTKLSKWQVRAKVTGSLVYVGVDRQRLLDRLHIQGYCDKDGNPREITKLSNLEAFAIIDRTNSVLRSFVNYYIKFTKNPKIQLSRWIYIIRYSCFKTLALKHKSTIREVLRNYGDIDNTNTIEDTVTIEIKGEKFTKTWRLDTIDSLMRDCRGKKARLTKDEIVNRYWTLKNGEPIKYGEKEKAYLINSLRFLERIN